MNTISSENDPRNTNERRPSVFRDGKQVSFENHSSESEIKGKTLDVYNFLAENPGYHGVRDMMRQFDYSSSSSIYYHLKRLLDAEVIQKTEEGKYGIITDEVALGPLKSHIKIVNSFIPRSIFYSIFLIALSFLALILFVFEAKAAIWFVLFFSLPLIIAFLLIREGLLLTQNLKVDD